MVHGWVGIMLLLQEVIMIHGWVGVRLLLQEFMVHGWVGVRLLLQEVMIHGWVGIRLLLQEFLVHGKVGVGLLLQELMVHGKVGVRLLLHEVSEGHAMELPLVCQTAGPVKITLSALVPTHPLLCLLVDTLCMGLQLMIEDISFATNCALVRSHVFMDLLLVLEKIGKFPILFKANRAFISTLFIHLFIGTFAKLPMALHRCAVYEMPVAQVTWYCVFVDIPEMRHVF